MSTVHNPTHFEPSDYIVEDYLDNKRPQYCGGPVEAYEQEIKWWQEVVGVTAQWIANVFEIKNGD